MNHLRNLFLLDPSITFLNFGSFGACPKPIFDYYQSWQLKLERNPVQFIVHDAIEELVKVRMGLGDYIGADYLDIVMVTNPSYAINTIARTVPLNAGDEILTTSLEYGACDRTWEYYCEKSGAKYIKQDISLPLQTKELFLEEFWKGCTERTKIIYVSHITSATGIILPVEELCAEAKNRGLLTIVDGAHVPGHINLDLQTLQADVYTGACHKWMMGPKGSSFLYVNRKNQSWIDPLLISWGYGSDSPSESQFIDYHQTAGTRDYAAFLSVSKCIEFIREFGWEEISNNCKKEVLNYGDLLAKILETKPLAPLTPDYFGQLFSIPIKTSNPMQLKNILYSKYRIEIPVIIQNNGVYLRFSYQAFNDQHDMERLFKALRELIKNKYILLN